MNKKLFGTSGIRGDTEKLLTSEFCYQIGVSFIKFLEKHDLLGSIAVGMDPRTSSPRLKKDLFAGLATSGEKLFDEGITPIPSMNWLLKSSEDIKATIMITGSHIAPELNGIKFFAHDEEISANDQIEIEGIYYEIRNKQSLQVPCETLHIAGETRAINNYSEMLTSQITNPLRKMKVAVDCANGAQTVMFPDLLRSLGLEVVEVNCDLKKEFIGRDTDTDDKAEIEELKKIVVKEKCDCGIAFDGDGDRSVFVDEKGNFIQGEYTCSLIAKNMNIEKVVTTIAASQIVESVVENVERVQVGSPHVVGKMKEINASFGFEQNGGAIFADQMYTRDGGSVVIKILQIFSNQTKPFSEMIGDLPKYYMHRTKVDYKWEQQNQILEKAKEEFKGIKTEELDGLKIWIDDNTWILFRSSKNAPEFRVFAESKDDKKAKDLLKSGMNLVKKIVSS